MIRILGFLIFFLSCNSIVIAAQLKSIVLTQQKMQTSLFLTLSGPFTHKIMNLSQPERVVIDLKDTQLAMNLRQPGLTSILIKQIRSYYVQGKTLRLVWDVNQKVLVRSSPWRPTSGNYGVRIDFVMKRPIEVAKPNLLILTKSSNTKKSYQLLPAEKALVFKPVFDTTSKPVLIKHLPPRILRDVIVVVDAGHGGKDAGARGPHNSLEKNVVLAISLKLKQLIDQQPGMKAVLTRSGDYYVGLRQRLDIARKYNGDIFVAIHADAFNNPHSNGASVFALSQRGATSEAARWIAEKENYSELGGVNLGDLNDSNGVVRSVLIDLSQTATINAGLQMGGRVLSQLGSFTRLHNARVEQARFMVLKSPDIPSILVETGFISNPYEERNLTNSAYQLRLSQAIFKGIKGYFWENPPQGSRIEALAIKHLHLVRKGETLPLIATRYHTTSSALQKANHLTTLQLSPGQNIVIPAQWA